MTMVGLAFAEFKVKLNQFASCPLLLKHYTIMYRLRRFNLSYFTVIENNFRLQAVFKCTVSIEFCYKSPYLYG